MDYNFNILDDSFRNQLPIQSCTEVSGLLIKWQMTDGSNGLQAIAGLEALLQQEGHTFEMVENNSTCDRIEIATILLKFKTYQEALDAANFVWRNKDYYNMHCISIAAETMKILIDDQNVMEIE